MKARSKCYSELYSVSTKGDKFFYDVNNASSLSYLWLYVAIIHLITDKLRDKQVQDSFAYKIFDSISSHSCRCIYLIRSTHGGMSFKEVPAYTLEEVVFQDIYIRYIVSNFCPQQSKASSMTPAGRVRKVDICSGYQRLTAAFWLHRIPSSQVTRECHCGSFSLRRIFLRFICCLKRAITINKIRKRSIYSINNLSINFLAM